MIIFAMYGECPEGVWNDDVGWCYGEYVADPVAVDYDIKAYDFLNIYIMMYIKIM